MKRKSIIALLSLLALLGLMILHIHTSRIPQGRLDRQELSLSVDCREEVVLSPATLYALGEDFTATFQRQVGDPITRTYTGVPLETLLTQSGLTLSPGDTVNLTAIDNYTIQLTYEEIITPDHAYITFAQDGQPLDDESGPYMLITAQDAVSTRWNRRLVDINLIRGGE